MSTFAKKSVRLLQVAGLLSMGLTVITASGPARADGPDRWAMQAANAKFMVYSFHCAPDFYEDAAFPVTQNGMEVPIASSSFRFEYDADCREYYLGVVGPLLKQLWPDRQVASAK